MYHTTNLFRVTIQQFLVYPQRGAAFTTNVHYQNFGTFSLPTKRQSGPLAIRFLTYLPIPPSWQHQSASILLLSLQICLFWTFTISEVKSLSYVQLLGSHRLQPARLLCPWHFPGKITGVGCHFLLQGTFPTQGLNLLNDSITATFNKLGHVQTAFQTSGGLEYSCL